ncbi:MAG TPA: ribonuclease III [Stellaceae bacterium]|nr:ribonuclease III [Stellaceae bacterium]
MSGEDPAALLGHAFAHPELLTDALTHPGAVPPPRRGGRRKAGPPRGGYERLEFLGDRVLGLVVAETLWRRFEREPEGDLTRRLTHLVRREALARVALTMGLDRHMTLSRPDALAGAAKNPAILADVCEAVIAAIYVDAGFDAAASFIRRWWEPLFDEMDKPPTDPKTSLQEWAQARGLALPSYDLVETTGPDHAPRFTVAARLEGLEEATATASSKRAAEAGAAAVLLTRLGIE